MFVIRGLMNHLVIVFVGVLIVVGIVNKDKIKTELTQMGYLESASTDVASASSNEEPAAVVAKTEAPAAVAQAAPSAPTASAPALQAMPTHLTVNASAPVAAAPALAPVQQASAQQAQQPFGNAPYYVQQQMQQRMRQQQMQQRMQQQMQARQAQTAEVALADDVKTQWAAARAAYWQRDLDKAEKLYKALLDVSEEAGVAGELGNIYYTHRRFEDAANMFFEAGLRHLKSDTPDQANMVMGPLSQLAPQKAKELQAKLIELHQSKTEASTKTAEPTDK